MPACVLMYHAVFDGRLELERLNPEARPYAVARDVLDLQLAALERAGVRFVEPREPVPEDSPRPLVLLTFDDGHASDLHHAAPVLEAHGARGVFFVTTGFVDSPGYLRSRDVEALRTRGHEIGSHGVTHSFLDGLDTARLEDELSSSRQRLQDWCGSVVDQLSLPGGRFDADVLAAAIGAGYRRVFSSVPAPLGSVRTDVSGVPRYAVRASTTAADVLAIVQGRWMTRLRHAGAYQMKVALRRLVGSERYHRAYRNRLDDR